ncbi:hypothetical protein SAMN00777080_3211 [Aquiflexum balticum DSM 16537]|uniref:Por secretion system C-terminal sorting domain-containing protein n=1 Tax=Aquiflexum balticum DSM 16537 TaxID=758820 RepID=A0A1W2H6L3_9BACT|nr:DUF3244 domain-containing protein [Aquiflexum balticum]SMD44587.1 hypothetical protein SAMN00777080_3211 [Aquiflexum balticum DSM 16537]
MKKLLTLALAATLGMASFANASNEGIEEMSSVKANEKKVSIILREGLGKVRLAIFDSEGKKLHQQFLKVNNDLKVPYDFSYLPAGEYQVMIESNINKANSEILFYTVETKEAPAPLPLKAFGRSIDDNSFKLTVVGLEEPGVNVEIFNRNGNPIFSEEIEEYGSFSKIYRLRNLNVKDISLKVTDRKGSETNLKF